MLTKGNPSLPILIVGGGLAGAALAQVLKANAVPFQIFERDGGPSTRGQGWAVALTECLPRLTALLPSYLGDIHCTSVNATISALDVGAVLHSNTGDVIMKLGGAPAGQPHHLIRASRERLRTFLWQDLDIQTNKRFSHYVEGPGDVTAYFTDGTSATGSLLIGIDGAHSAVRSQLLSQTAKPASFIPIIGTVTLSPDEFEPVHAKGSAAVIAGDDNLRWLLSLISIEPDRSSASYFYAVCYHAENILQETAWLQTATESELFDKAIALTTTQPKFFRDILQKSGPENIHHPPLRFVEFEPPASLPRGRVTLAGDAAHTMMPFKGAGANTAFLDICELAELLIAAKDQHGVDLGDAMVLQRLLQRYERVTLPRAKAMVAGSAATGKGMEEILGAGKSMAPLRPGQQIVQEKMVSLAVERKEEGEDVDDIQRESCITQ